MRGTTPGRVSHAAFRTGRPALPFKRAGHGLSSILFLDECQALIYGIQGQLQVFFRVTEADVRMMMRREEKTPSDKLGIEIETFSLVRS
jgi:hypothetical protein